MSRIRCIDYTTFAFPQIDDLRIFMEIRWNEWATDARMRFAFWAYRTRAEIMSSRKFPPKVGASARPIEWTDGYWKICVTGKSLMQTLQYGQSFVRNRALNSKKWTSLYSKFNALWIFSILSFVASLINYLIKFYFIYLILLML